jgi:hypothetical protein
VSNLNAHVSKLHSCVWESHSASGNCTLRVEITLLRVEITLCVWKLDSACRNHTLRVKSHSSCINYSRECHIYTNTCQNYTRVCGNHTLRVEIALLACGHTTLRVKITKLLTYFLKHSWGVGVNYPPMDRIGRPILGGSDLSRRGRGGVKKLAKLA